MAFLTQEARVVERFRIIEVVELVVELKTCALHRATSKVRQLLSERYDIQLSRQTIWRILSARDLARIMDLELMGKHVWVGLLVDDIVIEHASRTVAVYTI